MYPVELYTKPEHEARMTVKKRLSTRAIVQLADGAGFKSLRQLDTFLLLAEHLPASLSAVTGWDPQDPEYRLTYNILRKLMDGEPCRGSNGLKILRYSHLSDDPLHHLDYVIDFTPAGRRLAEKMRLR